MTEQEAIKRFEPIVDNEAYTDSFQDACRLAIEALEKKIPKKPIFEGGFIGVYKCPACKTIVGNAFGKGVTYCKECGNAIDWEEGGLNGYQSEVEDK